MVEGGGRAPLYIFFALVVPMSLCRFCSNKWTIMLPLYASSSLSQLNLTLLNAFSALYAIMNTDMMLLKVRLEAIELNNSEELVG